MSLLKNIEIWNNYIPRVCSFDMEDYCISGAVGNTCTNNKQNPNTEDMFTTARASSDALRQSIEQYVLSSLVYFYDIQFDNPSVSSTVIPSGLLNEKCITLADYNTLVDLYYGPNGLLHKFIYELDVKRFQFENSLLPDGNPNKKTGIETYNKLFSDAPFESPVVHTITVDYTNYQTPSYNTYLEFRTILGDVMQLIKKIMQGSANHPLTKFEIPEDTCNDITIGSQIWTKCNLDVDTYSNGDPIPQVQDPTEWANLTTGAWCYYENNTEYGTVFGKLYNWYAINDPRGLAPEGYHIPTADEWATLYAYLGGASVAGGKLKQVGSLDKQCDDIKYASYWNSPNTDATNISRFTGLPGGGRGSDGTYNAIGNYGDWWSSTERDATTAEHFFVQIYDGIAEKDSLPKTQGLSIRLVKGPAPCSLPNVTIGGRTWTACNLSVTTYRNGDPILEVQDPDAWANMTTGAWCYYNNDPETEPIYGKLYNWYAVNDPRGLGPDGYHVPTDCEWSQLRENIGGAPEGGKLKETGTAHWLTPNTGATNEFGFTAVGAGTRFNHGSFDNFGIMGAWWTSTEESVINARQFNLIYNQSMMYSSAVPKASGRSVRLIQDVTPLPSGDVTIGTQIWTGQNATVETYRNGDIIPQVLDPSEWQNLTTGAWCYYNNDPCTEAIYGKLYNWYAVNDPRGIAPVGYHVPTRNEWVTLNDYLYQSTLGNVADQMKETGTVHWIETNPQVTNSSGFTALPGGLRRFSGLYESLRYSGSWWSSTESSPNVIWNFGISGSIAQIVVKGSTYGLSLRFVKD